MPPHARLLKPMLTRSREIVAWTGLQYPWNLRPVSDELRAKITTPRVPTLAEGMFSPAMLECFSTFGVTKKSGWDIEKDYRECIPGMICGC